MQSFVRSLLKDAGHSPNGLAGIVAQLGDALTDNPGALGEDLGRQVRRALAREALATLATVGETPAVLSLDLWCPDAASGPSALRPSAVVHFACRPERRSAAVSALAGRGFVGSQAAWGDAFFLPGLSVALLLHHRPDERSPFRLDLAGVWRRAQLDAGVLGEQAYRPSAEDGLALWLYGWAEALWWGGPRDYGVAARWERHFPSDSRRLGHCAREHGLERVAPLGLAAAWAATRAPGLGALMDALPAPWGSRALGELLVRLPLDTTRGRLSTAALAAWLAPQPARGVGDWVVREAALARRWVARLTHGAK